jgi:3-methyl-2-oxobutanoate hydroxymethyltransferase
MRLHTEAVARGAGAKLVVADMPFLSFRKGAAAALEAARELVATGVHAVKLEGVDGREDVVRRLTQSGVPAMGRLGVQPQSAHAYRGFRVQGRSEEAAQAILRQAGAPRELGALAVALERIPRALRTVLPWVNLRLRLRQSH